MTDRCIYDQYDDCAHDCPNCPRSEREQNDADRLYDEMKEREVYG